MLAHQVTLLMEGDLSIGVIVAGEDNVRRPETILLLPSFGPQTNQVFVMSPGVTGRGITSHEPTFFEQLVCPPNTRWLKR